jgi:hypothetical protein
MRYKSGEMVLLGQAGYPLGAIEKQVERLCVSLAFDNRDQPRIALRFLVTEALCGRVPQPAEIAAKLGRNDFLGGKDPFVRNAVNRLREKMETHYAKHAKPDEIHLSIPPEMYVVFAPRAESPMPYDAPPRVDIFEPAEMAEVYREVDVRGVIEELDPDLRVWLIVFASDQHFYPQYRVSRRTPLWGGKVFCGRMQWGETDGVVFSIQLVAAGIDGDLKFHSSINARDDGFGTQLPTDMKIIFTRKVVRRDIRPGGPTTDRLPPKTAR